MAGRSCALLFLFGIFCHVVSSARGEGTNSNETEARQWLEEYNVMAMAAYYENTVAAWTYQTDITDAHEQAMIDSNVKVAAFAKEARTNASRYDMTNFSYDTKRQLTKLKTIGDAALEDQAKLEELNNVLASMESRYSKGKVPKADGEYLSLEPGLTRIMATSRDYGELNWAWQGWRAAVGPSAKEDYQRYVALKNEAAAANGFSNCGDYWKSWYEVDDFTDQVENLYQQLSPLYNNLHAYVRRKLYNLYGADYINLKGPIPAHILGNMWSQSWLNILDLMLPFENAPSVDITPVLVREGYNAKRMFEVSDEFFESLGLIKMPPEFWAESMIERPTDREVVCHASAWDFYNQIDFRIKQCTDITMDDFITIHHEMGHIEYYLQYKHLPVLYRGGANPGFHEAVGDTLALSVSTPKHLHAVGLLDEVEDNKEADLNFLMSMALDKIAFLPFGYLMDKWRWAVFDGTITPENFNAEWWKLRTQYQGIVPPTPRSEANFDPAAKYHIPSDTPYIRYFVSLILQFQFHKAMCDAAGHTGALLKCDVYNSTDAGKLLGDMLQMGESREWPEALEKITGGRNMSAEPLLDYFEPLVTWLEEQNAGETLGWSEEWMPKEPPAWPPSGAAVTATQISLSALLVLTSLVLLLKP
ncbi:angiotensin-converting enzyme-like isoform X2 [Acanthaster planci]|uniref:Angiotensin-converting enzyme n=1 Tax=Acanthaster planci TaxID=133434 RepID=A0A8B7XUP7_ACAPL|nr:angiotensin-converting enzyme-like isoform X2 [Acanthaster planci]